VINQADRPLLWDHLRGHLLLTKVVQRRVQRAGRLDPPAQPTPIPPAAARVPAEIQVEGYRRLLHLYRFSDF
jgi:hypothetical protein